MPERASPRESAALGVLRTIAANPVLGRAMRAEGVVAAIDDAHLGLTTPARPGTLRASMPATGEGPLRLYVVGQPENWLGWRELGARPSKLVPEGAAAVAVDVNTDTDVVQVAWTSTHEELRLLRSVRAPTTMRYEVRRGPGIVGVRARDARIEAIDATGRVVFGSAPLFAADRDGRTRVLSVEIEGDSVTLRLDARGLAYPIVVDPLWSTVASMASGRADGTAILLSSGKVLVVGGTKTPGEIYDPASNVWTATAPQVDACAIGGRLVVPLTTGKVMMVGGRGCVADSAGVTTGEVYDPATNVWSAIAPMSTRRQAPTGAHLPTGKVLVAGGFQGDGFMTPVVHASAELYDPVTNTWSAAAPMSVARTGAPGIMLSTGRFLAIAGRSTGFAKLMSAERYDPATNAWSSAGSATSNAYGDFTPLLLTSGKVLIAGGARADESTTIGTAWTSIYDPVANAWTTLGSLPARYNYARLIELTTGRALFVGNSEDKDYARRASRTDASGVNWLPTSTTAEQRGRAAAVRLASGKVLFAGGQDPGTSGTLATAEIYSATLDAACTSDAACDDSNLYCTASGICAFKQANGATCMAARECSSGHCVDGYCCNSACTSQCAACDVSAALGTCAPVGGKPHGARKPCDATGSGTVCEARCIGDVAACHFAATTTPCSANTCSCGIETKSSFCNGAGACNDAPKSCAPYACGAATCRVDCSDPSHCAPGFTCAAGSCVPGGSIDAGACGADASVVVDAGADVTSDTAVGDSVADATSDVAVDTAMDALSDAVGTEADASKPAFRCSADGRASISPDDAVIPCAPYSCTVATGKCATSCDDTRPCAAGYECNVSGACVPAAPSPPDSGGGCTHATSGAPRNEQTVGVLLILGLAAVLRRRT